MDTQCELRRSQCLYSDGFDNIYGKNEHMTILIHEPYILKKERFVACSENMRHHHHDRVPASPKSWMISNYMFYNSSNCQNPPILTATFLTT
jgi:hypothetical protein